MNLVITRTQLHLHWGPRSINCSVVHEILNAYKNLKISFQICFENVNINTKNEIKISLYGPRQVNVILIIYYSNFDMHRYKDFHRTQCTESTPLIGTRRFSSDSTLFSVVIEHAVDNRF